MSVPLYCAPLNKLSNIAMREVALENGADFVFSELIRCERLIINDEPTLRKLQILPSQEERTIIQIIAEDIENIKPSIEKLKLLHPKIKEINYNMGCPQSTLCSNELGCGILKNLDKVETIAKILVEVCKPLEIKPSIKTRLGPELGQFTLFDMTKHCLKVGLKKLYVHARYLHENYTVPAHYTELESFKSFFPEINLVVNGDITEYNKYAQIITKTNCDGVLIGRTAHTHPNIFSDIKNKVQKVIPSEGNTIFEKLPFCIRITQLGCQFNLPLNQIKGNIAYLTDKTKNGGKLREKINLTKSYQELIEVFMSEK